MIFNSPTISGSLTVTGNIVASGSVTLSGSVASASYAATASFVTLSQTASFVTTAQTASFVANAQSASNAVTAQTASYANALTVAGTLTAQTLVVQTITSSVDYVTGSTRFGSLSSNTHVFTGSVNITGSLSISSGSATPLFTAVGGLVGIGMNPVYKLDVSDAIRGLDLIAGGNTFSYDGTVRARNAVGNTNVLLHSNGNSYLVGGNVGIGTTSPAKVLDVYSSATTNTAQIVASDASSTNRLYLGTFSNNSYISCGGTYQSGWSANGSNAIANIGMFAGSGASTIQFETSTSNGVGPTERMRITSGGNVLIGTTTNPGANGTGLAIYASDYPRITLRNSTSGDTTGDGLQIAMVGANIQYDLAESGYQMWTTGGTERMRITSGGNVGIGITNPTDSDGYGGKVLDVNGPGYFRDNSDNTKYVSIGSVSSIGFIEANGTGNYLRFYTGGTEKMRISNAGYVCMNTTTATTTLNLKAQSDNRAIFFQNPNGADGSIWLYGASNTFDYKFSTWSQGSAFYLYNNGNYSFAGSNVSDIRLKQNIQSITYNAIEKIMQLVPKSYNMVAQPEINRNGFIAQEVKEVLPDVITGTETDEEYLGLDYNGLLAVAIKAIQELNQKFEDYKATHP